MSATTIPLAYKYVAIALMLTEANYFADRLQLPIQKPITRDDVRYAYAYPPALRWLEGRIDAHGYSFGFFSSGRLSAVTKMRNNGAIDRPEHAKSAPEPLLLAESNAFYKVATNFGSVMSINFTNLERAYPCVVSAYSVMNAGENNAGKPATNLLVSVYWERKVDVIFLMPSGSLIELRQNSDLYSERERMTIVGSNELLNIRDQDFVDYSSSKKIEMAASFGGPHCTNYLTPQPRGK